MGSNMTSYHQEWCEWLNNLHPWERHYVFGHLPDGSSRELDWFDDWVAGTVDLETLTKLVINHFALQFSVRV